MPRVKIDLPEKFIFQTTIQIRVTDLNYGGHLGNDNVLSIMHEARYQFIKSLGFENEVNIVDRIGIIVADCAVVYKSEGFYGDIVICELAIEDIGKYGFDLVYKLTNIKTSKEVARGKTGIVFLNYDTRKIASIPEQFLQKCT